MKPSAPLSTARSSDALVGVEIGLLAAAAETRASMARTPVSRAAWLLSAVKIADLGGMSLGDAPASLGPPSSAIGRAWAQSAERQRQYLARPAPPVEPRERWEGDYPIDGIHDLPEQVLMKIAADNLPRAEDSASVILAEGQQRDVDVSPWTAHISRVALSATR